jgi:hypothetical protein
VFVTADDVEHGKPAYVKTYPHLDQTYLKKHAVQTRTFSVQSFVVSTQLDASCLKTLPLAFEVVRPQDARRWG